MTMRIFVTFISTVGDTGRVPAREVGRASDQDPEAVARSGHPAQVGKAESVPDRHL